MTWGWRIGSVLKRTCTCRGSVLNSQHPHGGQPSVTPVWGDPTPPSDLTGHQAHTWCMYRQADKMLRYINNNINFK